jgi:IS4 transposase
VFSLSRFNQLLQGISRRVFDKSVKSAKADRYAKRFKTWDLLVLLIFGQLHSGVSMRNVLIRFNLQQTHHYHLGVSPAKRSTVSDAMAKRDLTPFETLCQHLIGQVKHNQQKQVSQVLRAIDSTPIKLVAARYDSWAEQTKTRRGRGLKAHIGYDLDSKGIDYLSLSTLNVNDITQIQKQPIEPNQVYIVDKGYTDYNWWYKIDQAGSIFITRMKSNAAHRVISEKTQVSDKVLADQTIELTNKRPRAGALNHYANTPLRRIIVKRDDGSQKPYWFITNDFERSAEDIAHLYKQRWQVELLFKWIKGNLKFKHFYGASENAVKMQIYVAIITYLLVRQLKRTEGSEQSLLEFFTTLQAGLFERQNSQREYYRRRKIQDQYIAEVQHVLF